MIVKPICPYCEKKITFKCQSNNRRKAKMEKMKHQNIFNIIDKCEFIH